MRLPWRMRGLVAGLLALAGVADRASAAPPELAATQRVIVRDVADGSGPSHLLRVGGYLLVVDPWALEIRRYALADPAAAPRVCRYPRTFAPWRSLRAGSAVRLIDEPYGPERRSGYRLRSHRTMILGAAQVAAMPDGAACRFAIRRYDPARDTPPALRWTHGETPGSTASFALPGGARARIAPQGGARAQVYSVRAAGTLAGGRSVLWWSEIDAWPLAHDPPGSGGRVTASQYVGVFARGGGAPRRVVRLQSAAYPRLLPGIAGGSPTILGKPGFEYALGASVGGRDTLFVLAADMNAPGPRAFVIGGYPLDAGAGGVIRLNGQPGTVADRNDAASPGDRDGSDPGSPAAPSLRAAWFARARGVIRAQIGFAWRYPAGAALRPCGGADRCAVGADASGALGSGPGFPDPVVDKIDRSGGANWMRPRHLIGLPAGAVVRGIPYSIGGTDMADDFAARLAGYAAGAPNPPPVGHIREGMEWRGQDPNYPLGIDCSALIARVFAIGIRSTGGMMRAASVPGPAGVTYHLPQGPRHACPEPVRHVSQMRPGDVILRDGHVVVYAGTARIGGAPGRSRALRVLEAGSRCGGVCESVYDPTYFDGWWIVRLRLGEDGRDCPRWLGDAPPEG